MTSVCIYPIGPATRFRYRSTQSYAYSFVTFCWVKWINECLYSIFWCFHCWATLVSCCAWCQCWSLVFKLPLQNHTPAPTKGSSTMLHKVLLLLFLEAFITGHPQDWSMLSDETSICFDHSAKDVVVDRHRIPANHFWLQPTIWDRKSWNNCLLHPCVYCIRSALEPAGTTFEKHVPNPTQCVLNLASCAADASWSLLQRATQYWSLPELPSKSTLPTELECLQSVL